MPQSLANILVHITFSTKHRQRFFQDPDIRDQMHRYLAGISKKLECPALIIGGVEDHVHVLARQGRTITLADWVKELKRGSSIWVKTMGTDYDAFQWQSGYGAFSVSQSQSTRVQRTIANQEQHHRKWTFQDELRGLLKKHDVAYDERYVWD